jgi:hypothetical protein
MTHQEKRSAIRNLVDLAMEHGPDAMAAAFATLASVRLRSPATNRFNWAGATMERCSWIICLRR